MSAQGMSPERVEPENEESSPGWAVLLAVSVAAVGAWVAIRYRQQPILELDAFRQTLTALTSQWIIRDGWRLDYLTPIVGAPWTLPFEFPLYQTVVAWLVRASGQPLEPVGRLLSFACLLACAWPAGGIVRSLRLPPATRWVFCALLWSSPLYLFWGRTFLIETAAVFLTLVAIRFGLDLKDARPQWSSLAAFVLFASLAMLQKSVTAAPALLVLGIVVGLARLRSLREAGGFMRTTAVAVAFAVPLLVGMVWTRHTDAVKAGHWFGQLWMSRPAFVLYVGTLADRMDPTALRELFWDRTAKEDLGGLLGLCVLVLGVVGARPHVRHAVLGILAVGLIPFVVFFPQYSKWEYYPAASMIFLIGALAVATVGGLPSRAWGPRVVPLVAALLVVSNLWQFWQGYRRVVLKSLTPATSRTLLLAEAIRRYTSPDSAIAVFGLSWSGELAFYGQRKARMIEGQFEGLMEHEDLRARLGGTSLGAVIFLAQGDRARYDRILDNISRNHAERFDGGDWYLWVPGVETLQLVDGRQFHAIDAAD